MEKDYNKLKILSEELLREYVLYRVEKEGYKDCMTEAQLALGTELGVVHWVDVEPKPMTKKDEDRIGKILDEMKEKGELE